MLGRLKMTVDECMEAFKDYGDDVFRHPRVTHLRNELGLGWLFGLRRSKYGHKSSITAIQKAVQDSEPDSGAWKHTTFAALEDHCKTYVLDHVINCHQSNLLTYPKRSHSVWRKQLGSLATYFQNI